MDAIAVFANFDFFWPPPRRPILGAICRLPPTASFSFPWGAASTSAAKARCGNSKHAATPCGACTGYSAVDAARNQMASDALGQGFAELMWIDSDIVFEPDAVERLRGHNLARRANIRMLRSERLACPGGGSLRLFPPTSPAGAVSTPMVSEFVQPPPHPPAPSPRGEGEKEDQSEGRFLPLPGERGPGGEGTPRLTLGIFLPLSSGRGGRGVRARPPPHPTPLRIWSCRFL